MKLKNLLSVVVCMWMLASCENDSEPSHEEVQIEQTVWKGTYTFQWSSMGELQSEKKKVLVAFLNDNKGYCLVENDTPSTTGEDLENFSYEHDKKLIVIKQSTLTGEWFISEFSKGTLILNLYANTEAVCSLELSQVE